MATKSLLYLHGFNSSPASQKAAAALQYFDNNNAYRLEIPKLPPEPENAVALISSLVEGGDISGVVGSSLGGYYSLFVHVRYKLPAVLLNPAIRPYELLSDYVGLNTNMYTGEQYEVKPEHMQQLLDLDVSADALDLSRLFLLCESEDEVLSYREAVQKLRGAKLYLTRGGDHSYQAFVEHLPAIHSFFDRILSKS